MFEGAVLEVVRTIPPGEVMTYGEVAEAAGFPRAARAVGNLLRSTTVDVPWWRVVGFDGTLRSPDPVEQARLLRSEGIRIRDGRVVEPAAPYCRG